MNYFVRALKYLVSLCVLYVAIIYAMWYMNLSIMSPLDTFEVLMSSSRGVIMIIAILALSFSYPVFGFMRQEVAGDIVANKEQIVAAFAANGFRLVSSEQGVMTFACDNLMKRISFLFEDKITVTQVGDKLVVEGIRRAVSYIVYRLEGMISFSGKSEE